MARRRTSTVERRPELRRAATLADVARLAGVSAMTASRALNQPELVAAETAARIRAAAERLAYVPNRVAGGLSSRKSHVVIAVIPSTLNPVFSEMVEALRRELLRGGYELFLGLSDYATRREDELVDAVIGRRPDAIVLTGVVHSPEVRWRLERAHIPVVETWDLTAAPIDMLVGFSNEQVGRAAAEHLLARGRSRLALVMADDQRALSRRRGFTDALRERGLEVASEVIVRAPSTLGMARDGLRRLLAADAAIDGVFCSSDQLAMGVLYEASARAIAVPERLAVVGFGNLGASAYSHPALTTVAVDGDRVGREAARLILERLAGKAARPKPSAQVIDVGSRVIARESA
jgi:LacI family transcriptional regulator, gluconate utilization system Gnt-I transcriptional repressor